MGGGGHGVAVRGRIPYGKGIESAYIVLGDVVDQTIVRMHCDGFGFESKFPDVFGIAWVIWIDVINLVGRAVAYAIEQPGIAARMSLTPGGPGLEKLL